MTTLTAQETYAMLAKQSLWDAAKRCHEALAEAGIPHLIAGGVAVCLHGYQRNTVDVDVLARGDDGDRIRAALGAAGFTWDETAHEFRSDTAVPVQFLTAGDRAGSGSEVLLPDPADPAAVEQIEDLPVLSLARLIEAKIACGEGSPRRTHKDFADVVELIAKHELDGSFARHLHQSVKATFRKLVKHARSS
jgi:hypothetical protein